MNLKDTKILIPEVPGEWPQISINGALHTWNAARHENGLPELILTAPAQGLSAKRIDGAWYWVCVCERCLGTGKWGFHLCEAHDRCDACNCVRSELKSTPWMTSTGWCCKPCMSAKKAEAKAAALALAEANDFSESDCSYADSILCPHCATEQSADDIYTSRDGMKCSTCDGVFDLEIDWSPSYTTKKATPKDPQK